MLGQGAWVSYEAMEARPGLESRKQSRQVHVTDFLRKHP